MDTYARPAAWIQEDEGTSHAWARLSLTMMYALSTHTKRVTSSTYSSCHAKPSARRSLHAGRHQPRARSAWHSWGSKNARQLK